MADLALPQTIIDRIDELERRLRDTERNPRLNRSSVQGGRVAFYSSTGQLVCTIGDMDDGGVGVVVYSPTGEAVARMGSLDGGTDRGVELFDGNANRVLRADLDASKDPVAYVPAIMATAGSGVLVPNTGGAYLLTYAARVVRLQHRYVRAGVTVSCPASTTAVVRLRTSAGQTSSLLNVGASTSVSATLFWELTANIGTPDLMVWYEVRNPSGPGNVTMGYPELALGDFASLATTAGFWL